jgi:hypothetical protein
MPSSSGEQSGSSMPMSDTGGTSDNE